MEKKSDMEKLINLMTKALRHKIGSIVNFDNFYVGEYAKDAEVLMQEAEKVLLRQHWNNGDKKKIRKMLLKKLKQELEEKEFLNQKKFEIMEEEADKALEEFDL